MSKGLSLFLYNVLLPPGLLAALPGFLIKMRRRGGYGPGFSQRLGRYGEGQPPGDEGRPVWIHAVSVGEVLVANKLIAALRAAAPGLPVVLSTTTSTGHAVASRQWASNPAGVTVIYNPVDLPWIVGRALRRIRPRAIVLVEAEVWPNLVNRAKLENIPVLLVNARLSRRSERRYGKFRPLVAPVFGLLDRVCVQEPEDAARWETLGVSKERITLTGSIKFDQQGAEAADHDMVTKFRGLLEGLWGTDLPPMILAASTHAGEEAAIGKVFLRLRRRFPRLVYLVAPRHFERAPAVAEELRAAGLSPCLRSTLPPASREKESAPDTLVIDTTGELRAWQALPDLVIMGKSFLAEGGQNPVEAVAAGVPVVTGPHMENFAALMTLFLKHDGVIQVDSLDSLADAAAGVLENPERSKTLIANARRALEDHRGAVRATASLVLEEANSALRDGGDPLRSA